MNLINKFKSMSNQFHAIFKELQVLLDMWFQISYSVPRISIAIWREEAYKLEFSLKQSYPIVFASYLHLYLLINMDSISIYMKHIYS